MESEPAPRWRSCCWKESRASQGTQTLAHLRTEVHPMNRMELFPAGRGPEKLTVEGQDEATAEAKALLGYGDPPEE